MRFESDKNGEYRANTKERTPSPAATFLCARCGGCKQILGRKKISSVGRRSLFAFAACVSAA